MMKHILVALLSIIVTHGALAASKKPEPASQESLDAAQAELDALKTEVNAQQSQIDTLMDAFPPKRVFVTSEIFTGDLGAALNTLTSGASSATGIAAGNGICQVLAESAGLSGDYLAWLGTDSLDDAPVERFTHSPVEYVNTAGGVVATSWSDLVDGAIQQSSGVPSQVQNQAA